MVGRTFSLTNNYKFGFNGQEKDDEVYGAGNLNTALFWEYDTRLGRRWNLDPKPQVGISEYSTFNDNPIYYNDIKGDVPGKGTEDGKAYSENPVIKALTWTDVSDMCVLVTTVTRDVAGMYTGKAINIDGTEATNIDRGFAIVGAAIPFVSGSAVKNGIKKTVGKVGIEFAQHAHKGLNVAYAISKRGALRDNLIKQGIDMAGKEAHHIIPVDVLKNNKVAQDAVNAGFDFNGAINGIGLTKVADGGVHAKHNNYSKEISKALDKFSKDVKDYTPEKAKHFLEDFANNMKGKIEKESVQGGQKVNNVKP